jgi:hypothetical protein
MVYQRNTTKKKKKKNERERLVFLLTVSIRRLLHIPSHHFDDGFWDFRQTARVDGQELILDGTDLGSIHQSSSFKANLSRAGKRELVRHTYGWQYCTVAARRGLSVLLGPPQCQVVPRKYLNGMQHQLASGNGCSQ